MKIFYRALFVIALFIAGAIIYLIYRVDIRESLNQNELIVTANAPLEKNKITIVWTSEYLKTDTIFLNGKDLGKIYKAYGKNGFDIYYDNKKAGRCSHFKTCNWDGYKYTISLSLLNDSIVLDCNIEGPFPDSKMKYFVEVNRPTK